MSAVRVCDGCGAEIVYRGRGRPRRWCDEIAAKKRAYYEANRGEIAAKKRARDGLLCGECGERLRHATPNGLCGFCVEERAA